MTTTSAKQSVASRLHAGESFIVSFGGQATPWRETLESLVATDSRLASDLVAVDQAVRPADYFSRRWAHAGRRGRRNHPRLWR